MTAEKVLGKMMFRLCEGLNDRLLDINASRSRIDKMLSNLDQPELVWVKKVMEETEMIMRSFDTARQVVGTLQGIANDLYSD